MTAALSQISIPIPVSPVPLTLSLAAVFLCGAVLPPKYAALSQAAYILLGAAGLPVFAGMKGGLGALIGPTGGYLASYPLIAASAALSVRLAAKHPGAALPLETAGCVLGLLICYTLGTSWLAYMMKMTFAQALMAGVVPFALLDFAKAVGCVLLGRMLRARLPN